MINFTDGRLYLSSAVLPDVLVKEKGLEVIGMGLNPGTG